MAIKVFKITVLDTNCVDFWRQKLLIFNFETVCFLDTKVGLFVKILGYTKKGVRLGGKKVGKNLFTVIFSLSEEEIVDNSKVPLSHVKLFWLLLYGSCKNRCYAIVSNMNW